MADDEFSRHARKKSLTQSDQATAVELQKRSPVRSNGNRVLPAISACRDTATRTASGHVGTYLSPDGISQIDPMAELFGNAFGGVEDMPEGADPVAWKKQQQAKKIDEEATKRLETQQHVEELTLQLKKIRRKNMFYQKPESAFMQRWDLMLMIALIFTAIVTPYEVAFVSTELDALFVVNRLVDLVFICDMANNFMLVYYDKDGQMIKDHGLIAKRYMKGWFFLDFLTILPYDSAKYLFNDTGGQAKMLRLVRLLRLLKLLRILRASRLLQRWETRVGITHIQMTMLKLIVMIVLATHWLACMWGLIPFVQSETTFTWMSRWMDGQKTSAYECTSEGSTIINAAYRSSCWRHIDLYMACLYWSMMTVTSIGYGDIIPTNTIEYGVSCVFQLIAGISWAHIIGQICAIAATGDPVEQRYHQMADDMNRFMKNLDLPPTLRQNVRMFLRHTKSAMRERARKKTLSFLSPSLAGQVAGLGASFVRSTQVWWLKGVSTGLKASLISNMSTSSNPPREMIPARDRMYVLKKGTLCVNSPIAQHHGDINTKRRIHRLILATSGNTVWNDDIVIGVQNLRYRLAARTVTYVEVDYIDQETLFCILDAYPEDARKVRRRALWMTVFRMIDYMSTHSRMTPDQFMEAADKLPRTRSMLAIDDIVAGKEFANTSFASTAETGEAATFVSVEDLNDRKKRNAGRRFSSMGPSSPNAGTRLLPQPSAGTTDGMLAKILQKMDETTAALDAKMDQTTAALEAKMEKKLVDIYYTQSQILTQLSKKDGRVVLQSLSPASPSK